MIFMYILLLIFLGLKPDSSARSKSFLVNFFNVFRIVVVVAPELPPESGRLRDLDNDEDVQNLEDVKHVWFIVLKIFKTKILNT